MLSRMLASVLLFVFFASLLAVGIRPIGSASRMIIVPDDYPTIQDAIDNATSEDTIFVRSGTYLENIDITKTISLIGENKRDTIIYGGEGYDTVVHIKAEYVSLTGFTVRGSHTDYYEAGLDVDFCDECNVTDNIISDNYVGVGLYGGSRNTFCRNTIVNSYLGVSLSPNLQYATLKDNVLANNTYDLVFAEVHSSNDIDASNLVDGKPLYFLTNQKNILISPATFPEIGFLALADSTNVTVRNLNTEGASLYNCANCTIEDSTFHNASSGIRLGYNSGIVIRNNTIINNDYGILITWMNPDIGIFGNFVSGNRIGIFISNGMESRIIVSGNVVSGNEKGIYLRFDYDCVIRENEISNNSNLGIYVQYYTTTNRIYHNSIINNPIRFDWPPCIWDDGYPSGGNYWSDYVGNDTHSGPYQNITGSDGIGDTPYAGVDHYPLMKPYVPPIGDVNGDWKVNLEDIWTASRAFGSIVGDQKWNPQADINHDGKIDMRDIVLIARNFGKTYR